jgi:AcrR family transcriptional regulator
MMELADGEALSRGEITREQIITAAHDLFTGQGYHGTSMRQIAARADIALGGLYNHFPSKEAVFEAVLERYHPYREVMPAMLQARGDTVEEVLRSAAEEMVAAIKRRPKFLNLMFIEIVEFNSLHIQELFSRIFPTAVQIAQRFQNIEADRMRSISSAMLIRSFLGLFFSFFITEYVFSPKAPPEFSENGLETMLDIYLHGLLKPEITEGE